MDQGSTAINGPHQGAWVTTPAGENWFIHFQDKGAYGRVVHLQPMKWINDWPVIGSDKDGDGRGEPVLKYKKPNVGKRFPVTTPPDSDEFNEKFLGLQWQWMSNPKPTWAFMNPSKGMLRLYSDKIPDSAGNLWFTPNVLLQKFPAEEFMATTKFTFTPSPKLQNEKAGLVVMGFSYAYLGLKSKDDGIYLVYGKCTGADQGKDEIENIITKTAGSTIYVRVKIASAAKCKFSYSLDGQRFAEVKEEFQAETGRWIGAKLGIFCTRETQINDSGYADFDWFRVERASNE
jgi:beta-xylosidase